MGALPRPSPSSSDAAAAPKPPGLPSQRAALIVLGGALLLAFALLILRAPQALPHAPGLKAVVFAPAEAALPSSLSAAPAAAPPPARRSPLAAGLPAYPRRTGKEHAVNASRLPSRGQGRGFLPGRHVPGDLDLQVLFLSRPTPTGAQRRAVVRSTFALLDAATFTVAYYWALTPPADAGALAEVLAENATHGDIAWSNPALHDEELTNKIHDEMRVGAARGAAAGGAPFWVKLDDDVLVLWERFLPTLYAEMPREGLVWCGQGTGHPGIYCNGPYLYSMDVVARLAADQGACCGGGRIDDWWFPNIGWNSRAIWNFGADLRWHNECVAGGPLESPRRAPRVWPLTSLPRPPPPHPLLPAATRATPPSACASASR